MLTNRISAYFDGTDFSTPETSKPANKNFAPVPPELFAGPLSTSQIYQLAYQKALEEARQRLLELLRSRMYR